MANVFIAENTMKAIANAIRSKTGKEDLILPENMESEIKSITGSTGSGDSSDLVKYVTFMSQDGTTELFKMPVLAGDDCKDPIAHGDIAEPTKESTERYTYSFVGWAMTINESSSVAITLKNVTEDRTVYAAFEQSVRYYTVNFYDGETLVDTVQVEYGATATTNYQKSGYDLVGWTPSNENITQDTDCYGEWLEGLTFANGSWARIAEISEAGEAANYFSIGDTKTLDVVNNSGETVTVTLEIAAMDYDELSDGTGKAGLTIVTKSAISLGYKIGSTRVISGSTGYKYYYQGWGANYSRQVLNGTSNPNKFYPALPEDLLAVVKTVNKSYNYWDDAITEQITAISEDEFWLLSAEEVNGNGYPIFSDNASRIKSNTIWGLRDQSTYAAHNYIAAVTAAGVVATDKSSYSGNSYFISVFGFCI